MKVYFEFDFEVMNNQEFFQIFCSNPEKNIKSSEEPISPVYFKWEISRNFIIIDRFLKI